MQEGGAWVPGVCVVGAVPPDLCCTVFRIGGSGARQDDAGVHPLDRDGVLARVTFTDGACHVAARRLPRAEGSSGRVFSKGARRGVAETVKAFAQHRGWAPGAPPSPWALPCIYGVDVVDGGDALLALPAAGDVDAGCVVVDPYSLASFGPHAGMRFSGRIRTDGGVKVGASLTVKPPAAENASAAPCLRVCEFSSSPKDQTVREVPLRGAPAPPSTLAHDVLLTATHAVFFASAAWDPAVLDDPGVVLGASALADVRPEPSSTAPPPRNALVFVPRGDAADAVKVVEVAGFVSAFGGLVSDVGGEVTFTALVHREEHGVEGAVAGAGGALQAITVNLKQRRARQLVASALLPQRAVVVHPGRTARPTRYHYTRGTDGVAKYDALTGLTVLWRPPPGYHVADLLFIPAASDDARPEDDGYLYVQLNTHRRSGRAAPRRSLVTLLAPTSPKFTHHATLQCPEYLPPAFSSCATPTVYVPGRRMPKL